MQNGKCLRDTDEESLEREEEIIETTTTTVRSGKRGIEAEFSMGFVVIILSILFKQTQDSGFSSASVSIIERCVSSPLSLLLLICKVLPCICTTYVHTYARDSITRHERKREMTI